MQFTETACPVKSPQEKLKEIEMAEIAKVYIEEDEDIQIDYGIKIESIENYSSSDNFEFPKNPLYYMLNEEIEGKIILGKYKKKKILLDRRLTHYIIRKVIMENPIRLKITQDRFLELRNQLVELFPTVNPCNWFSPRTTNIRGESLACTGSLYNYYKCFRSECIDAGIIGIKKTNFPPNQLNNHQETEQHSEIFVKSELINLMGEENPALSTKSIYTIWSESFSDRQQMLIDFRGTKMEIQYSTYINNFWCLKTAVGLSLLIEDCNQIIKNLVKENKISEKIAADFGGSLMSKWPTIADKIVKIGDESTISEIKNFRFELRENFDNASSSTKALLYLPFLLTKCTTIKKPDCNAIRLTKSDISEFFISFIENESELDEKIASISERIGAVDSCLHPFIICCGKINNITKTFVVINRFHYQVKTLLVAVDYCFKACTALHTWSNLLSNVYAFLQQMAYDIKVGLSIAFVPKSLKVVDTLMEKIAKNSL
uniref:Uncharacterized protein n=1 Tax=Trichogramma kaykai TaxID=54128 RepID=A0ABD2W4P2_9HYME